MNTNCPWCDAPVVSGPKCPKCGAIYAKAEAIRLHGKADPENETEVETVEEIPVDMTSPLLLQDEEMPLLLDPVLEWKFCIFAFPTALILGCIFHAFSLGHFFQRTFLSMPVHEFGHAFTSWFCGYAAVPTLWKTITAESRGIVTPLLVTAAVIFTIVRAMRAKKWLIITIGIGLLIFQLIGTLILSPKAANTLIIFNGDGGAMVFGIALMSTFFYGKDTQLYRGSLRWGFLVIGAASFVDTFSTWWHALSDTDSIPFGELEGIGLSDPSRLLETYGWTENVIVHRYVTLGICCLLVLACFWIWGILEAKKEVDKAEKQKRMQQRQLRH